MAYYIHNVPGRLRIKTPVLKYDSPLCLTVENTLKHIYGVEEAMANPMTGSIIVKYDKKRLGGDKILDILIQNKWYDEKKTSPTDTHFHKTSANVGERVGKVIIGWAVQQVLEANGLSVLAAII